MGVSSWDLTMDSSVSPQTSLGHRRALVQKAGGTSYHAILVIDLNDNDGGVITQLVGLPVQLQVVENQHLVPGGAQRLIQHLQRQGRQGSLQLDPGERRAPLSKSTLESLGAPT